MYSCGKIHITSWIRSTRLRVGGSEEPVLLQVYNVSYENIVCYFWAIEIVTLGVDDWSVFANGNGVDGGRVFIENMSSRAGHVDVNERRLRPIYGQYTFAIEVKFFYIHAYTDLYRRSFVCRMLHVLPCCVNHVLDRAYCGLFVKCVHVAMPRRL